MTEPCLGSTNKGKPCSHAGTYAGYCYFHRKPTKTIQDILDEIQILAGILEE